MYVNLKTAAALTRRSPMTIRAALDAGELGFVEGKWHGGTKGAPGRVRWIDADELRAWHEAHGGAGWYPEHLPPDAPGDGPRLAGVERRLAALEAALGAVLVSLDELARERRHPSVALEALIAPRPAESPSVPPSAPAPSAARSPVPTIRRQRKVEPTPDEGLPSGWVALRAYGVEHGGAENQYNTWVGSAYLGAVKGRWRAGQRGLPVYCALDPAGQARFHALWREKLWFRCVSGCRYCEGGHEATSLAALAPAAPTAIGSTHSSGSPQSE